jgi:WD40 repeat protein
MKQLRGAKFFLTALAHFLVGTALCQGAPKIIWETPGNTAGEIRNISKAGSFYTNVYSGKTHVFDAQVGKSIYEFYGYLGAFFPDESTFAYADPFGADINIVDLATGQQSTRPINEDAADVASNFTCLSGTIEYKGDKGNTWIDTYCTEVLTGHILWHWYDVVPGSQWEAYRTLSPDGQLTAIALDGPSGGRTEVINCPDGVLLFTIDHFAGPGIFSPDNHWVLIGTELRDVRNSGMLVATLPGRGVAFSPDSHLLACYDGSLKIYSLDLLRTVRMFDAKVENITDLAWNGGLMIYGSYGNYHRCASDPSLGFQSLAASLEIIRGNVASGGLADIQDADDQRLVIRPGLVFFSGQPPIEIEVDSRTDQQDANIIEMGIESSGDTHVLQTIMLFDFELKTWTEVGAGEVSQIDDLKVVDVEEAHRFIQDGTGKVRAKFRYSSTGPRFTYPWFARIDYARWRFFN